jgi:beta-1,4-mannosyl-glycoprotein beta-1,4-N-acetylglucosaminyltransferase
MGLLAPRDRSRRGWRQVFPKVERQSFKVTGILIFLIAVFSFRERLPFASRKHVITASDLEFENGLFSSSLDSNGFLDSTKASRYCAAHSWEPFPHRNTRRKVYDLVMVNSELDWLEIRLNELHEHVDYFVILESPTTFTGLPKNLTLAENWQRFEHFRHKIIYHVLTNPPLDSTRSWDYEYHQRNAMYTQVLPYLTSTQAPNKGDVILVSDLDEIPRPATLTLLRNCEFPLRLTLRSKFYYYSFQWRHRGQEWAHPQATTYTGNTTILPQNLRGGHGASLFSPDRADLWNAAWHCSSCFSTIEEMLLKMKSFSHTELNKEEFREKKRIVDRVRRGKDLWDRWGQNYDRVEGNHDVPGYLRGTEKRKFGYLLDRDGEDAGFVDYKVGEEL